MIRYVLTTALSLCLIFTAQADIINGYYYDLLKLEKKINRATASLEEATDIKERKKLEKALKRLNKEMDAMRVRHAETEELINEVWKIDSALCALVSGVTNAEGSLTHVYIKVVSRTSEEYLSLARKHYVACAYTSVGQAKDNPQVCTSRAGTNTVTITVCYGSNALKALGHEFAHVLYIVPNLEAYIHFWQHDDDFHNGHSNDDPSYFALNETESSYLKHYMAYVSRKE